MPALFIYLGLVSVQFLMPTGYNTKRVILLEKGWTFCVSKCVKWLDDITCMKQIFKMFSYAHFNYV